MSTNHDSVFVPRETQVFKEKMESWLKLNRMKSRILGVKNKHYLEIAFEPTEIPVIQKWVSEQL